MRPAPTRPSSLLFALLALAALLAPVLVRASADDRLDVQLSWARGIERFHSIEADSLGVSFGRSYSPALDVDFRALDLPVGKTAKPGLHFLGEFSSDERTLGPAIPGQPIARFPVLDLGGGILVRLPLEAFLKGNSGVAAEIGWRGAYVLTRTGGNDFLQISMAQLSFLRTSGGLQGSSIRIANGRDETYGRDVAANRWDVRLSLQGRLIGAPTPPALVVKPGQKAPPAPPVSDERRLWWFGDLDVNTDGGPGADGLSARFGLAIDLGAFVSGALTPHGQ